MAETKHGLYRTISKWRVYIRHDRCSSKFPEIDFMRSTSANNVINSLDQMISIYGIPEEIVSDNGPPFKSFALKEYMESKGIHHRPSKWLCRKIYVFAEENSHSSIY